MNLDGRAFDWRTLSADKSINVDCELLDIRGTIDELLHMCSDGERAIESTDALKLLSLICSFQHDQGRGAALVPEIYFAGRHSGGPLDVLPSQIEWLKANFAACPYLDLRARMADTVFSSCKPGPDQHRWRTCAAQAYTAAVEAALTVPVNGDDAEARQTAWVHRVASVARVAAIAKRAGRKSDLASGVGHLFGRLASVSNWERCGPSGLHEMIDCGVEFGFLDPALAAGQLIECAELAGATGLPHFQESHLALAAVCFDKARQPENGKKIRQLRAMCLLDEARAFDEGCPGASPIVADRYRAALKALRDVGGDRADREFAQQRMIAHHQGFAATLPQIHVDGAEERYQRFHGQLLEVFGAMSAGKALRFLAFAIGGPPTPDFCRRAIGGLLTTIPSIFLTSDGRVVGGSDDGPDAEFLSAAKWCHFHFAGFVVAAVSAFALTHKLSQGRWRTAIQKSAFIDPNRLESVITALHFGLAERWEIAAAVLYPQIEHHFRRLLRGKVDIVHESPDVQGLTDIGVILNTHQDVLGDEIGQGDALAWRVLAGGKHGPNRRNYVAHGIDDDCVLGNHFDIVAWWLLLRLVLAGPGPAPTLDGATTVPANKSPAKPRRRTGKNEDGQSKQSLPLPAGGKSGIVAPNREPTR